MANLSPDERVIIAKHPLDISLDHLQDPLRKIEQSYEQGSLSYNGVVDSLNSGPRKAISGLLSTLNYHEVAFKLRSKTRNEDIASELFTLGRRVVNGDGDFSYEHYHGLEDILREFPEAVDCVKLLCRKIRGILFPYNNNYSLVVGTPPGPPAKLHDPIIGAFDTAIADMPKDSD